MEEEFDPKIYSLDLREDLRVRYLRAQVNRLKLLLCFSAAANIMTLIGFFVIRYLK